MKIPKFKTESEEAKFWDTHDSTQFLHEMKEVYNVKFPAPKHKSMVIDLEAEQVEKIKKIARRKHVPYHTLIQQWLKERLSSEKVSLSH